MGTKEKNETRVREILALLDANLGTEMRRYLHYETPWQLLVAVVLSAQCTDARVNEVTKDLFAAYPTPEAMAAADLAELEKAVYPTGFYRAKAAHIRDLSAAVAARGGEVPRSLEELTALPGVGRKTANVIRGHIYGEPSIVVDTHVKRIAKRLGFTNETEPYKVEKDLMRVLPRDHWILCNLQLIALGRSLCTARGPKCGECFLKQLCPAANTENGDKKHV